MTQACKPLTLRRENAIPGLQELFVVVVAGFDLVFFFFSFALFFFLTLYPSAEERRKRDLRAELWGLLL